MLIKARSSSVASYDDPNNRVKLVTKIRPLNDFIGEFKGLPVFDIVMDPNDDVFVAYLMPIKVHKDSKAIVVNIAGRMELLGSVSHKGPPSEVHMAIDIRKQHQLKVSEGMQLFIAPLGWRPASLQTS